jgi:hypothetical protein
MNLFIKRLDCFVAYAPRNDEWVGSSLRALQKAKRSNPEIKYIKYDKS